MSFPPDMKNGEMCVTINVEMAKKILEAIKNEPKAFDMDTWMTRRTPEGTFSEESLHATESPSACDTTLCVAGWAVHLEGISIPASHALPVEVQKKWGAVSNHLEDVAMEILGLDFLEQANGLFYASNEGAIEILEFIVEKGRYPEPHESRYV